ncbi:MAG: glycosyltransferase [Tannerellaceae bacterium]|jgi:hypothetical protein|nr:glycosyltransferase [Tannerellaceae bacterium]
MNKSFRQTLKEEFEKFLLLQQNKYPPTEILKVDLHCHDYNSDVPDELIGRILNVPETWLPSEILMDKLRKNNCTAFTITNHNNARSCYALQDKGVDILTAAEFSCRVPDFEIGIHVLTYGFTPDQEVRLDKLRKNLYRFLEYARQQDIPTIWAHPLYHYSSRKIPPASFFNKMLLVFERFEVVNGQRDTWQNLLVKEWLESISPEDIDRYAGIFGIDPLLYCTDPYQKAISGGSDCHMGIFAGTTGSCLYVPNLAERLRSESRSQLALEAIRFGRMAPYGTFQNAEKMTIAFLDYACQITLNYTDPGLLRMLLHKGSPQDKLISFVVSNLFSEVRRHRVTTTFVRIFHESLMGKKPSLWTKIALRKDYQPIFDEALRIAGRNYRSITEINRHLYAILAGRLEKKLKKFNAGKYPEMQSLDNLIEKMELPVSIRSYVDRGERGTHHVDISAFLDGLSFPFFGAVLILAAHFISARTMFNIRPMLRDFSERIGRFAHPERILWLTDSWDDGSEAARFLGEMHGEIKRRQWPVDILTCSSRHSSEDHLIVLPPVGEFTLPFADGYRCIFPDFLSLHNLFLAGEYDRVICSTEGAMGFAGLYLKHAYSVEASFCMHTDRIAYAQQRLHIEGHNLNRFRRILRFFYHSFDQLIAMQSDTCNAKVVKEMMRSGKQACLVNTPEEMFEYMIRQIPPEKA